MFGHFENFPNDVHGKALIWSNNLTQTIQEAILRTFHNLNYKISSIASAMPHVNQNCITSFEFGVADGLEFIFLDRNELDQGLKTIIEKELEVLDFFCVIRYHLILSKYKRVPLRFDYFVIRFLFKNGSLELSIRHEKGTRRIPLDELKDFLIEQINCELSQKNLDPLSSSNFKKISIH